MTYTADTPIIGVGLAAAALIESWMAAKGRQLAPRFAPDGQYKAPPAGIGAAIVRWSNEFGVNSDIVAADIMHESAGWQSSIVREKNNPSGLGATNDNPSGNAITFATPDDGCRATAAHMASYAIGAGDWAIHDPRYAAVKRAGWLGVASSLSGLDGRWAFPGVGYGGRIAAAANDLLAFGDGAMGTIAKPQMDTTHRSPHMDGYGSARQIEAAVQHIANGTLLGTLAWFANPESKASANYLISKDGAIYEIVPPGRSPWTNGPVANPDWSNPLIASWAAAGINPNTRTLTIEHVGQTAAGAGGALTTAQWQASIHLNAWLSQEHGYPPDRAHLIGHYQIDSVNRGYCPGYSASEWDSLVSSVASMLAPPPSDDALYLRNADGTTNIYPIVAGFRAWCEAMGRARGVPDLNAAILSVTGYPHGAEYGLPGGGSMQDFERMTLFYTPGNKAPWDIVVLPIDRGGVR